MKSKNGFTLVELIVTMSAGVTLMLLSIGVLHQAMSLASLAKERCDHAMTLDRLAREFRTDVHDAESFQLTDATTLQLRQPDGSVVEYVATENRLTRRQRADQATIRREVFQLSHRSSASFESLEASKRISLTVLTEPYLRRSAQPRQQAVAKPRVDRHVVAVVGKWMTLPQPAEVLP